MFWREEAASAVLQGAVDDAFAFATLPNFGAAFGAAFDLPAAGVARSVIGRNRGVGGLRSGGLLTCGCPHLGVRWSSRCLMLL